MFRFYIGRIQAGSVSKSTGPIFAVHIMSHMVLPRTVYKWENTFTIQIPHITVIFVLILKTSIIFFLSKAQKVKYLHHL